MRQYRYPLPVNFDPNNPEFNLFKDYSENLHEVNAEIKKFENVRVANNGAVFNYFNIFNRSDISSKSYNKRYRIFARFIPKVNFCQDKKFVLIFDQWTHNYYHWISTAIYRLLVLKENNLLQDSILILPDHYKKFPYINDTLRGFGIKAEQILYLNRISNIKIKELFTVKINNHFGYVKEIKKFLASNLKNTVNIGDKIYISRQRCFTRNVKNEDELVQVIKKYGFKKVIMEDYSYQDQISIASNAKYMIGPHGAGLTNALFMKDGSQLLELSAKLSTYLSGNMPTDYYRILPIANINYLFQDCEAISKVKNGSNLFNGELVVDLQKLEENIQLMLKNT